MYVNGNLTSSYRDCGRVLFLFKSFSFFFLFCFLVRSRRNERALDRTRTGFLVEGAGKLSV